LAVTSRGPAKTSQTATASEVSENTGAAPAAQASTSTIKTVPRLRPNPALAAAEHDAKVSQESGAARRPASAAEPGRAAAKRHPASAAGSGPRTRSDNAQR
jgi:hypothetical protein